MFWTYTERYISISKLMQCLRDAAPLLESCKSTYITFFVVASEVKRGVPSRFEYGLYLNKRSFVSIFESK